MTCKERLENRRKIFQKWEKDNCEKYSDIRYRFPEKLTKDTTLVSRLNHAVKEDPI